MDCQNLSNQYKLHQIDSNSQERNMMQKHVKTINIK